MLSSYIMLHWAKPCAQVYQSGYLPNLVTSQLPPLLLRFTKLDNSLYCSSCNTTTKTTTSSFGWRKTETTPCKTSVAAINRQIIIHLGFLFVAWQLFWTSCSHTTSRLSAWAFHEWIKEHRMFSCCHPLPCHTNTHSDCTYFPWLDNLKMPATQQW